MFQVVILEIAPGQANVFTHPILLQPKVEGDPPVNGLQITITAESPEIRMIRRRALLPDGTPNPDAPAEIRARIAFDSDTIIIEEVPVDPPPVTLSAPPPPEYGVDEYAGSGPFGGPVVGPFVEPPVVKQPLTPSELAELMKKDDKK